MKEYNGKPLVEGLLEEIKHVYRSDNRPWVIGYSGGKDSTVVVHLVYQMLKNLRPEERHKTVSIFSFWWSDRQRTRTAGNTTCNTGTCERR